MTGSPSRTTTSRSGKKARSDLTVPEKKSIKVVEDSHDTAAASSYLALCINTTGLYKVCAEITVSKVASDAQLFLEMKRKYLEKRGRWTRYNLLVRPMTIEFIQVSNPGIQCVAAIPSDTSPTLVQVLEL
jgi:hypothetical protein